MQNIKLSIVIPTKNRYEYLLILIKELLSNKSTEFEIIVQDNSDNNEEIKTFLDEQNDERLKYFHNYGWLSVIDNCDLGIQAARGMYICMLGDDDGILIDHALKLIKHLEENNVAAANVNKMSYAWPDTIHKVWSEISGKLYIQKFKFTYQTLIVEDELKKVINQGGAFGLGKLPRVYHAFVKKTVLDQLKEDTGTFFPGPSPDMANAVGLCNYLSTYLYADYPIIISGHGKSSAGGQGGNKEHHGKIENQVHLPKDTVPLWSEKIPFFWSGPTIYSESARRAIIATHKTNKLNYAYLYACCLVYEKHYKKEIYITINKIDKNKLALLMKVYFYYTIITVKRYSNFIKNTFKYKFKKSTDIQSNDISEAIQKLIERFKLKQTF